MLAVVVPHGVLFRGGAEGRIREAMLAADVIEAVVGLAPNLFYGAGIPAALLICRKKKPAERNGKVLIVNGDATYTPGKAQNSLTNDHIRTLADSVRGFADISKLARVVPVEEIAANGHNLNISRYVHTGADAEAVDVAAEVTKLEELIANRNEAEDVMFEQLRRLGYAS